MAVPFFFSDGRREKKEDYIHVLPTDTALGKYPNVPRDKEDPFPPPPFSMQVISIDITALNCEWDVHTFQAD